jgi:hypothetical protein
MKILEVDRCKNSKKLYAITILGMRFDFRRWYQLWTEEGEDLMYPDHEGWSQVWFSEGEFYDELWYDRAGTGDDDRPYDYVKRDSPLDLKNRKIPLLYTICNWSSWWYKNKKLLAGILIGFLLSLLINRQ